MANPSQITKGSSGSRLSVIGDDLTITGNVVSKGEVQVDGIVQGDVQCATLLIGESAQVTGGIYADDIVVRGRVVGSVRGTRVTLQGTSHVEGDIYHQSLAIEQGAFFEGKSRRSDDPAVAVDQPQAPAPSREQLPYAAAPQPRLGQPPPASKPPRAAE